MNRLVQRPASYEILRIVTPVLKRWGTDTFLPADPARSCADVSVLTGRRAPAASADEGGRGYAVTSDSDQLGRPRHRPS
ncbi:MAG: hypothetical protein OXF74_10510 [Rhodobacteraceae bacterium]|nr:hypothetical protein [Paracoccaceae bacterium]